MNWLPTRVQTGHNLGTLTNSERKMASSPKIPAQLYVVSKREEHRDIDWNKLKGIASPTSVDYESATTTTRCNLGFLHPHQPKVKADASRKKTQHSWAYKGNVYQVNDDWWHKGAEYGPYDSINRRSTMIHYDEPLDTEHAPRVWDNTPMSGFKIVNTVSRDRGNKLFRVLDPRGLEFEITAQSLFRIIQTGAIEHGVILSQCVWATNKNLVVV